MNNLLAQESLEKLDKTDLKILLSYNVSSVYVCDANFGINGKRDVAVVQFIADEKKKYRHKKFPNVQYGGYAKTNKHFERVWFVNIITILNNEFYKSNF